MLPLCHSLSVARLLLPKHMDYRQKDSCFLSSDCSRHSGPPARSQGIIWHSGIPNTKCGCIPEKNTELSLFAHTGTQDTRAQVQADAHTNKHTYARTACKKQFHCHTQERLCQNRKWKERRMHLNALLD